MINVCKFGGTSVANAKQIEQIKSIVLSDDTRKVVVVSAVGKDALNAVKMTDMLFLLYAHIEYGVDFQPTLTQIKKRFVALRDALKVDVEIEKEIDAIEKKLDKRISKDFLVSRGEYLTAKLIARVLGYTFVDAMDVIHLKYDGRVDEAKTQKHLENALKTHQSIVVPGYYAATPSSDVRLFSRGGSDLTGSIIAKALHADAYENFTDVSGIYSVDPTIVKDPKRITNITYDELRELSYRGARVLHQESIIPLEHESIPIYIKNTFNPEAKGTKISNTHKDHEHVITGIAGTKDYTSFNIKKNSDTPLANVLKDVLDLMIRYRLTIEHIPTGIDSFSVVTKTKQIKDVTFDLINDIRNIHGIHDLALEGDIALIAIVGRKMSHIPGIAGKIFSCLGEQAINIKIIAQASTEISIIIGVSSHDYEDAIRAIYQTFFDH